MRFKKKHYRQQVDMRDCGVAALAMVVGYYGSYYSLASLREKQKRLQMERQPWVWLRWQKS